MSAASVEHLLAALYTDPGVRREFSSDPNAVALRYGLDAAEAAALARIDRDGLELAARSYAVKRASHVRNGRRLWTRWF